MWWEVSSRAPSPADKHRGSSEAVEDQGCGFDMSMTQRPEPRARFFANASR
jgi:hypothetical protein